MTSRSLAIACANRIVRDALSAALFGLLAGFALGWTLAVIIDFLFGR